MKSNAQGFCAQARFLPKAACHRFFFGRKVAAKASRNTSFPQIAPASQLHRPARPLYTWQRRCKENSRRMDMDVPWFRTCRRPISTGQHICTGTRLAHPEFLPGPGIPKQTYGFSVPRENQTVIRAFRSKHPACRYWGRRRRKFPRSLQRRRWTNYTIFSFNHKPGARRFLAASFQKKKKLLDKPETVWYPMVSQS